jgi:hypothetical protein
MKRGNIMRLRTFYLVIHAAFLSALAVPQLASAADDDFRDSLVQTVIDKWQNTSEATSSPRWESGMKAWLEQRSTEELDAAIQLDSYDSLTDMLLTQSDSSNLDAALATGKVYYSLSPCRLADTRKTSAIAAKTSKDFYAKTLAQIPGQGGDTGCVVPAGATAAVVNITATAETAIGHLRAYPAQGVLPNASILNYLPFTDVANSTILPLCLVRRISQYTRMPHLM